MATAAELPLITVPASHEQGDPRRLQLSSLRINYWTSTHYSPELDPADPEDDGFEIPFLELDFRDAQGERGGVNVCARLLDKVRRVMLFSRARPLPSDNSGYLPWLGIGVDDPLGLIQIALAGALGDVLRPQGLEVVHLIPAIDESGQFFANQVQLGRYTILTPGDFTSQAQAGALAGPLSGALGQIDRPDLYIMGRFPQNDFGLQRFVDIEVLRLLMQQSLDNGLTQDVNSPRLRMTTPLPAHQRNKCFKN